MEKYVGNCSSKTLSRLLAHKIHGQIGVGIGIPFSLIFFKYGLSFLALKIRSRCPTFIIRIDNTFCIGKLFGSRNVRSSHGSTVCICLSKYYLDAYLYPLLKELHAFHL
ncbi:hypothetical protein RCL_jg23149.t1 [Rhizophagus clarus]|uniref:Uncharacterized protein n=1 Tax=Rhizophagus clarus TaxID=94130 RepID=A0A8H3L4P4_9GLOM|nr:hypothetical protein RCL_jg23149.t1 [Rhizophagus clarus]